MLWPFQFQNYLPGPRYQVLAINPICHHPHILVDFYLKPNLCRILVDVMTTFPHRVILMCIFQQPVYIHLIQDLLLTTKNNQNPIHFSTFSRDQSRRLGLGPTYAVSLSIDKIHYNFLQQKWWKKRKEKKSSLSIAVVGEPLRPPARCIMPPRCFSSLPAKTLRTVRLFTSFVPSK